MDAFVPGTNVGDFKNIFAKKSAEKVGVLIQNTATCIKLIITLDFKTNTEKCGKNLSLND
jgi:hypothetical protein